jgi:hypothetical protein
MYFPFGIRTRREGTMMLIALSLFFSLRPVSDADTSSALWSAEVLNTGGGFSGYRRFAVACVPDDPISTSMIAAAMTSQVPPRCKPSSVMFTQPRLAASPAPAGPQTIHRQPSSPPANPYRQRITLHHLAARLACRAAKKITRPEPRRPRLARWIAALKSSPKAVWDCVPTRTQIPGLGQHCARLASLKPNSRREAILATSWDD